MRGRAFLEELTTGDREALVGLVRRRRHANGECLLRQGEPGDGVVLLLAGRVKLVARAPDGRETLLGVRGEGDLLGEVSALDGEPRGASVIALQDGEAGMLTSLQFRAFMAERSGVALAVMRLMARRLREADRGRVEFATQDALGRVALRLLELAERYGVPVEDGVRIELPLTQDELAGWTGSSRQAVARALGLMRRIGWVSTSRRAIVVHDLEAMRERLGRPR